MKAKNAEKRFEIIVTLIVIVTIVIVILMGTYVLMKQIFPQKISAKEGEGLAHKIASEWHTNITLVFVQDVAQVDKDGRSEWWMYKYLWLDDGSSCIEVSVSATREVKTRFTKYYREPPIINWTIDSTDAMNIAKHNSHIRAFLSEYRDAIIESMFLAHSHIDNKSIWSIYFHSSGMFDNPHNARIIIDAHTGEILEVETQMD